jgi:enoyl-[acyl-carrier protein] reductase I
MNNLLKGKKGIIFGALNENSIAWKAAERIKEEGGEIILTNSKAGIRIGDINLLAKKCKSEVIPADITSVDEIERLFDESKKKIGNIDFILHSVAMSRNIRKNKPYNNLNYKWFMETIDTSALSFHKIIHIAEKKNMINKWGSILSISYIGSKRNFPEYSDMSQAKAMLESIARSYGYILGKSKKIRVNTISQSPTITASTSKIDKFKKLYEYSDKISPLGNANTLDCANYIVFMFSDLSRMITMQNLIHDGGFSYCGM